MTWKLLKSVCRRQWILSSVRMMERGNVSAGRNKEDNEYIARLLII
ncbi:MAG: hypothetical protein WBJ30_06180 [Tepidanaerobacteraceae bacterium]|nr:hypothetical protein [Tepidanaerobacteraceae bacterium]